MKIMHDASSICSAFANLVYNIRTKTGINAKLKTMNQYKYFYFILKCLILAVNLFFIDIYRPIL